MYGKVFRQIFTSSVMEEDVVTRYVWLCMIALADKDGVLDMTRESLARTLNLDFGKLNNAVEKLLQPDASSRSRKENGRRLIPLSTDRTWGWLLVNYPEYSKIRNEEERREYMRFYMRNKRKNKDNSHLLANVNTCKPQLAHTPIDITIDKETTLSGKLPDTIKLNQNGRNYIQEAKTIIEFLNSKTGRRYELAEANVSIITARLKEGASLQECKSIISKKVREWESDEKMYKYLRPATLFNKLKFSQYKGELGERGPNESMPSL